MAFNMKSIYYTLLKYTGAYLYRECTHMPAVPGTNKPGNTIERLQNGDNVTIAALGDSLTHGWMVSRGYIDVLYEMLSENYPAATISIINSGIPGDTAEGGLHRLQRAVINHDPHCVFIQFALNDAVSGYTPATYGNYIRAIIRQTRKTTKAEIVLISSTWLDGMPESKIADSFYEQLEEISGELNVSMAPVHRYWEQQVRAGMPQKELVQFDGVHPTEKGYRIMAEAVFKLFL